MNQTSHGFDLEVTVHATGVTVSVSGDLDVSTSPALTLRAGQLRAEPGAEIVVDLSGAAFCDSAGISALVALRKRCDHEGWRLRVVNPQPAVRRMLVDYTGLGDYLNVV